MLATVLKYEGALAVEQKLAEIAHTEGDEAVARVAQNLSSAEVAQVTAEGDFVKPSLLHTAITPEQFRGVFRRIGRGWSAAEQDDCPPDMLHDFQNELGQFLCAFILLQDDEARRVELLGAILEEPHGLDTFVFATIHEKDFDEFIAEDGKNVDTGDWREVLGVLRRNFPEEWGQFKRMVLFATTGEHSTFVHDTAAEMYAVAFTEGGGVRTEEAETAMAELYTPLL